VAGAVVLAGIVLGVPAVLAWVAAGGPAVAIVHVLEHPASLPAVARRPMDDTDVVAGLVLIATVVWGWLLACIVIEVAAQMTGRPRRRLPAADWLQQLVALVVSGAMVTVPLGTGNRSFVGAGIPRLVGIEVAHRTMTVPGSTTADLRPAPAPSDDTGERASFVLSSTPGVASRPSEADAAPLRTYVVQPGDTLWSIAARTLGSPLRWRQIAAVNLGRPQPDGERMVDDHWIRPGWVLVLPPSTVSEATSSTWSVPVASATTPADGQPQVDPAATVHPSPVHPSPVHPSPVHPSPVHPSAAQPPTAQSPTAPPGQHERNEAPRVARAGSVPIGERRAPRDLIQADRRLAGRHTNRPAPSAPVELIVGGILAAGVVGVIDRLRRAQQRRRPSGLRIALPPAEVAALEGRLRRAADARPAVVLAGALRELDTTRRTLGRSLPSVAAARVGEGAVELLLDEVAAASLEGTVDDAIVDGSDGVPPTSPPSPFVAGSQPGWWSWPTRSADRIPTGDGRSSDPAARPGVVPGTMVTLGSDGDTTILGDLAVLRSVAVAHPRADAVCHALAVELATTSGADGRAIEVVLLGFAPSFDVFDRVARLDDPEQAVEVVRRAAAVRQADRLAGRVPSGASVCTVLLWAAGSGSPPSPVVRRLIEAIEHADGTAAAVLGFDHPTVRWRLVSPEDGMSRLERTRPTPVTSTAEPFGTIGSPVVPVVPQEVSPAVASGIAALVGIAADGAASPGIPTTTSSAGWDWASRCATDGAPSGDAVLPCRVAGPQVLRRGGRGVQIPIAGVDRRRDPGDEGDTRDGADLAAEGARPRADDAEDGSPAMGGNGAPAMGGNGAPASGSGDLPARDADDPPVGAEVLVRVLGPVTVEGAERPFARAWTLDLVVYLALHQGGATTEQWSTALWPDRLMAAASLHSTASAARRALGAGPDGTDHLPRSHGRLQLAPSVTTDWSMFEQWADDPRPDRWRRALGLVRGRPLQGLRSVDWAILEGILPTIESTVVDVAERFALVCLDAGDPATAQWAARRGLAVCPYDERLYRILLRAADQAGNPAGVEAVMAELVRVVAEDVEPYDAVHPETLALYRSLTRRSDRLAVR
jgi:DNA-binding SARP family transcriptional activator